MKNFLFICFLCSACLSVCEVFSESEKVMANYEALKSPKTAVNTLVSRALDVLNKPGVNDKKISSEFQDLVLAFFAIDSISKFTLGVNARLLSESQKKEFTRCFINMVVKIYSAEFLKYKSGKFKTVQEKKASENHTLVYSTFLVNGNLHKVDWSLFLVDGKWLIFDLKVNGISISQIQKAAIDGKISEIKRAGVKDVLDKFLENFAIDYGK